MCVRFVFLKNAFRFMPASLSFFRTRLWLGLVALALFATRPACFALNAPTAVTVDMTVPSSYFDTYYAHTYYGPTASLPAGTPFFLVSWADNSTDEDFFEVQAFITGSLPWTPVAYAAANSTASYVSTLTSGAVTPAGKQIQFRVYACKGTITNAGITVSSRSAAQTPTIITSNYPATFSDTLPATGGAPTNFAVSIASGTDSTLHFAWTDNCVVEEAYEFYFSSTNSGATPPSGSTPAFVFNWGSHPPDVGTGGALTAGQTYYMWVRARRSNGTFTNGTPASYQYGPYSNEAQITMPTTLTAPTALTATALSENKVRLTWTNNSGAVSAYNVLYQVLPEQGTGYTSLGTTQSANSVDLDWYPGLPTEWEVQAVQQVTDGSGNTTTPGSSAVSNAATLTLAFKEASGVAASFAIDPTAQAPVATVTWTPNSLIATGYLVQYRQTGTSTYSTAQVLSSIAANSAVVTSDSVGGVYKSGVSYDFQVVAYYTSNAGTFQSNGSPFVSATVPDGITSLTYAPITLNQAFSYQMTVSTGSSLSSSSITGLPGGLSFTSTAAGGNISGTPVQAGLFVCPMTATFDSGVTDHKTLTLRVLTPPAAPTTPKTISDRTIPMATATLPLGEFFADLDTEAAVKMSTTMGDITIVLQPTLTPATYANFMGYATNTNPAGNYAGSVFHRVSPGFVLQGGGYKPITGSDNLPDNFAEVTQLPSPPNEPGISNFANTVALAKGATPSSGTHDFFISLADNRSQLDNMVGGFTVFGRVINNSPGTSSISPTVDAITSLTGSASYTVNLTPSGSSTPVTGFNPLGGGNLGSGTLWPLNVTPAPAAMDSSKCVVINSVTPIPNLLTYSIVDNSNSSAVAASVDASNNLLLQGQIDGQSSSVRVLATDLDGNTTSQLFNVNVVSSYQDAVITAQPQDVTAVYGDTVRFTVVTTGQDLQYQWRKNKVAIPGANAATLELDNVASADVGDYQVAVSNAGSYLLSSSAHLYVHLPPTITVPPVAHSANYGTSTTFTVTVTGDAPLTYAWYKGTPGSSTVIDGATTSTLTLPSLLMTDAGMYYVVVTNTVMVNGSPGTATSAPVQLIVNPVDSDGDGISDDVELTDGLLANQWDTDGDGYSDGVEMSLQTDPRVASSNPSALWFVAQHDGAAALASIAMKRVKGTTSFPNSLNNPQTYEAVPDQWMGAKELTNDQYASILDYALRQMNVIEIVSDNDGRRFVRYPKGSSGQPLCYLVSLPTAPGQVPVPDGSVSPVACDIGADAGGTTFYVAKAVAKYPVRSVSWYGGYLATLALNTMHNYTSKCLPASWSYNVSSNGYRLPSFTSWQWSAQGTTSAFTYPTGNTISTAKANYASSSPKPTGSYPASALGICDMAGNVAEWTSDPDPQNSSLSYARGGSFATPATANGMAALKCIADQQLPRTTITPEVGVRLSLSETATPTISAQPADEFVKTGDPVTLAVTADGAPPLVYQWYKNNVAVAGQTAATLSIAAAALTDAGAYTVKISSQGSATITSSAAHLSVLNVPSLVSSLLAVPNKPASLPVTLASSVGTGQSFSYAWYLVPDLTNVLQPTSVITGTTTSKLAFSSISVNNTGTYVCKVTPLFNGAAVAGNSNMVPLTVTSEILVMQPPSLIVDGSTHKLPTTVVGGAYQINLYTGFFDTSTELKPTTFTVTGLPPGLTLDPKTGIVSGRATKVYDATSIQIQASNAAGVSTIVTAKLNVLAMPLAATGTFVGSIGRQAGLNSNLGGRVDLTASGIGAFTGSVTLGASVYKITGNLGGSVDSTADTVNNAVTTQVLIPRAGKNSLLMALSIDTSTAAGTFLMSGSIGELPPGATSAINVTPISGWRNVSSSIGGTVITTSQIGRQGYHTLAFDPPAGNADPTQVPQGETFVTASVASAGTVTLGGRLADGTVVTGSSVMGTTGQVLMYQPLYGGVGSTLGKFSISGTHAITIDAAGITWSKNGPASSTDRIYKTGFGPQKLVLISGGLYTPPSGSSLFLGVPLTAAQRTNVQFTFASGGLSFAVAPLTSFMQLGQVTSKNLLSFVLAAPNAESVAGTLVPSTGVFTGTFKFGSPPARTATYYGVVVPDPANAGAWVGHGSFTLPSTSAATSPILSGLVLLQKSQ